MKNNSLLKKSNSMAILKSFILNRTMSKQELADATGLTFATVNNAVNDMIISGLVFEDGIMPSNGGRKAMRYRFNLSKYKTIGVEICIKKLVVTLFDLGSNIIKSLEQDIEIVDVTVEEYIRMICELCRKIILDTISNANELLGVGIVVPGVVDYENGIIRSLPSTGRWVNIPIGNIVENELKIPVCVDNDSNAAALALKWKKVFCQDSTAVYFSAMDGIGSGILINGEIFRGSSGISGEFGHVCADIHGPVCSCGNRGCYELYASDMGIRNNIIKLVENRKEGILYDACRGKASDIDFPMIIQAASQGDTLVHEVLEEAALYLAECIKMILRVIGPSEIIIDNSWLGHMERIYFSMLKNVYESVKFIDRNDVKISISSFGNMALIGTGTIVLDKMLQMSADSSMWEKIAWTQSRE